MAPEEPKKHAPRGPARFLVSRISSAGVLTWLSILCALAMAILWGWFHHHPLLIYAGGYRNTYWVKPLQQVEDPLDTLPHGVGFAWGDSNDEMTEPVVVPYLLLAGIVPALALGRWVLVRLRSEVLVEQGCCGKCGYSLTGNVSGVCPECGWKAGLLSPCFVKRASKE